MLASHNPEISTLQVVAYGLLVPECAKRNIQRTTAFRLAREGLIETFLIGRRRYVKIASLDSLPDRLPSTEMN